MKTKLFTIILVLSLFSCKTEKKAEHKVYDETWESLSTYNKEPDWFVDSKLGIYFTWGPYTVPQFQSEWYPRWMYLKEGQGWTKDAWRFPGSEGWARGIYEHHEKTYGPQTKFSYHDFIPMFKAENFDAAEWADLFQQAGAKFAGPIAQHHDGFAMWDSDVNMWNAMDKGPHKDIVGSIISELKKRNMKTIATFHHARNLQRYATDTTNWGGWDSHFPYHPKYATSTKNPVLKYLYGNIPAEEFHDYWYEQIREVVDKYAPDAIWFDTWLNFIPEDYLKKMVALQLNTATERGQKPLVICKQEDLPPSVRVLDMEQSGLKEMAEEYWMTDITLSFNSWSYVEPQTYKPIDMLLRNMIDVWSKKGIVLLNVCPRADGIINHEQQTVLKQLGSWLDNYGEAVYGTRAHSVFGYGMAEIQDGFEGEGQSATQEYTANDVRFTTSKDGKTIYALLLGMPKAKSPLFIEHIASASSEKIKRVSVLGKNKVLEWTLKGKQLKITTPSKGDMNELATVFKIEFE